MSSSPAPPHGGSNFALLPSGLNPGRSGSGSVSAICSGTRRFSASSVNPDVGTSGTSTGMELSSLFRWNPTYRPLKKRKGSFFGKGSKKKKLPTWTHTLVCLSRSGDQQNPDPEERCALQLAGLGEKRFPMFLHSDAQDIHTELLEQFPKLEDAGGYEFLRLGVGGVGNLQLIKPPPHCYSVEYLRAVIGSAKIFIRPLQHDLDLTCDNPTEVY